MTGGERWFSDLFQGLVGEDMDGDGCGESQEKYPEDQAVCYEDRAVEQSDPDKADRDNFDSEGDCFVNHEVGDVRTEFRVGEKPLITVFVAAEEESCRKQKEWCGWQYREEGSENSQSQSDESQYCKKPLHISAQKKGKLITSHRYDLLPLLRSSPGGIQRELVV